MMLVAPTLQLKAVKPERQVEHLDPEIPFRRLGRRSYEADGPFDVIVVCRNPNSAASERPLMSVI